MKTAALISTGLLMAAATMPAPVMAAAGSFYDGNELLSNCRELDGPEIGTCYGYLMGVADGRRASPLSLTPYCLPDGVSSRQLRDIVVRALEASPETRQEGAGILVARALNATFACPRQPK